MNLCRIGGTVLNLDRINGIVEHQAPTDPGGNGGGRVLVVMFDQSQIELTGSEAEVLRRWYRHASYNLAPRRDEEGEELISPEDQVRKAVGFLLAQVDRARPRDPALRHAARRVAETVDLFLTGELQPAPANDFAREFDGVETPA